MTDACDNMGSVIDSHVAVMFVHFDGLAIQMWKTEQVSLKAN